MAKNILIELYVPALFRNYDVYVAEDLKIIEVIQLVGQVINDLNHGQYKVEEQALLCLRETGEILDINLSVRKLKLSNGSQLMVI